MGAGGEWPKEEAAKPLDSSIFSSPACPSCVSNCFIRLEIFETLGDVLGLLRGVLDTLVLPTPPPPPPPEVGTSLDSEPLTGDLEEAEFARSAPLLPWALFALSDTGLSLTSFKNDGVVPAASVQRTRDIKETERGERCEG